MPERPLQKISKRHASAPNLSRSIPNQKPQKKRRYSASVILQEHNQPLQKEFLKSGFPSTLSNCFFESTEHKQSQIRPKKRSIKLAELANRLLQRAQQVQLSLTSQSVVVSTVPNQPSRQKSSRKRQPELPSTAEVSHLISQKNENDERFRFRTVNQKEGKLYSLERPTLSHQTSESVEQKELEPSPQPPLQPSPHPPLISPLLGQIFHFVQEILTLASPDSQYIVATTVLNQVAQLIRQRQLQLTASQEILSMALIMQFNQQLQSLQSAPVAQLIIPSPIPPRRPSRCQKRPPQQQTTSWPLAPPVLSNRPTQQQQQLQPSPYPPVQGSRFIMRRDISLKEALSQKHSILCEEQCRANDSRPVERVFVFPENSAFIEEPFVLAAENTNENPFQKM